jgi:hypothetical protein
VRGVRRVGKVAQARRKRIDDEARCKHAHDGENGSDTGRSGTVTLSIPVHARTATLTARQLSTHQGDVSLAQGCDFAAN